MKRTIIIISILVITLPLFAPSDRAVIIARPQPKNPYKDLWQAMASIESANDPTAINVPEQAYGIVQIRKCKLSAYNKQTGHNFSLQDCLDPNISYKIWIHFASKYGHHDPEKISKRWNGSGPMTNVYWNKIKRRLKT